MPRPTPATPRRSTAVSSRPARARRGNAPARAGASPRAQADPGAALGLIGLDAMAQAAECLRTLAHPHRLRIVEMLLRDRHTVGALAQACGIPSHMASEHLRLMRDRGLLDSRREGREVYYHVREQGLAGIMHCISGRFGTASTKRA